MRNWCQLAAPPSGRDRHCRPALRHRHDRPRPGAVLAVFGQELPHAPRSPWDRAGDRSSDDRDRGRRPASSRAQVTANGRQVAARAGRFIETGSAIP